MISLKNNVIFITGASSGIGRSCAFKAAEAGARLLLCSRNIERLEKTAQAILEKFDVEILTFELDVRDPETVQKVIENLPTEWRSIDILINNAGLARGFAKLHEGDLSDWDEMIDTNIKGLLYVSRAVLPTMIQRNRGHVINIGSLAGRGAYPNGAVYCATKAAVKNISDGLRMDVVDRAVRVTDIQPGLVETNFSMVRFHGDRNRASSVYEGLTPLTPDDVAETVIFAATRPAHVQINEILITPTSQASSTVIWKEPAD